MKGTLYAPPVPAQLALRLPPPRVPQIPPPDPDAYNYTVISSIDADVTTGGARYAFLEGLGRHWAIVTRELGQLDEAIHPHHTFGMDAPTLRWVNDHAVTDVYVDGMSAADYFEATGLRFHNEEKGPYVLSKRISRIMRPHFISGMFEPDDVTVRYMDAADYAQFSEDAENGPRIWDGAGVISRGMLDKLLIPEGTSPGKAARLRRELAHTDRVEFTLMTEGGQDKGHAMVAADLDVDFLLPRDTKREITLESGKTWVGVDFVHGKNHMRLDIQSLINLQPFFDEPQFASWLHDEGEVFAQAVRSGDVAEVMGRIDRYETLEDVQRWATREFFASGGHPLHFQQHVKSLMNRHLERLNESTLAKMRIPIPGGRYYVMPQAVGTAAGYQVAVAPGEIRLDHARGTAWVNDADWLGLDDSPAGEGIAGILGGADHDDALWVHPFTDNDGQRRVLAWRSPNQLGEYIVMRPTADSDIPHWTQADGQRIAFPAGDSRQLPQRIDQRMPDYLGLVDPASGDALGRGEAYSVAAMDRALERSLENRGALGMYCNSLMVNKAVFNDLPARPPAPLEDIIDGSVKTGADLSRVVAWNYANTRQILEAGTPVPRLLHPRLSIDYSDKENPPPLPAASHDHWLDRVEASVKQHIAHMQVQRDALVGQAIPPRPVFDSVFDDPGALELGARFNATYSQALVRTGDFERAREESEGFLKRYPDRDHSRILRGALVSSYMSADKDGKVASDAAVWQRGKQAEDGRYLPGIAQKTLRALREIGLLDELSEAGDRVVTYPGAAVDAPVVRTLGIRGVWFNLHKAQAAGQGQPLPLDIKMRDVPKVRRTLLKKSIERFTQAAFREAVLTVTAGDGGELLAVTRRGNVFGTLQHTADLEPGDRIQLHHTRARDGNLRATYSKLATSPTREANP